ncbi:RNB-domain-containing protein [Exidia glandulosa HHB12029]|uniref:RNB-domain-containing protein n=1 Tax=Exidia glandulosa HHB12029 TaxID=1314781 RepID=A0A165FF88_EXIGL|nr:RNB-domain-containing protein [Exidia glandulosa HHB12029]
MATSHSDIAPTVIYGDSEDTYIRPGSFVELRRNQMTTLAVLLRSTLKDTKPTFASLTASGEVFTHDASDSMWVSPDFVTPDIVEQCGIGDAPETAAQHSARVHVVRQLRRFERKFERKQSEYGSRFPKLYDELRNPDPAEWAEVKTADVAAKLKGSSPTVVDGLAAHRLLMDDSFHYLAHPRAHRVAQSFLVRPLNDVRNHERVIEMFRDPDNAQIESFVRKARSLLQFFNERDKSAQHPPRPASSSHNLPKFDEDDQRIILFLRQAAMSRRSVQRDWYLAHAMRLLKKVAFFTSGKALTHSDVFSFLKAIGVAAPWEDESWTMPHMYALSKGAPGSSAREQRHEQLAQQRPTPEAALTLTPNADEFYPRDIMQDLRRDFGDMPVYVIDDPEAKELDDGVSVEPVEGSSDESWIHIHIADPTMYLHPQHEISAFARQIATTVYARHRTWAMLPNALTISRFSLGAPLREDWPQGQPMETMTFSVRIHSSGEILETKVSAGYIRRPVIVSYDSVDRVLGPPYPETRYPFTPGGKAPERPEARPLSEDASRDLKSIERVAQSLRRKRMEQPLLFWQLEKPAISIPSERTGNLPVLPYIPDRPMYFDGYPIVSYGVEGTIAGRAQLLVTECMILAARVASRTATQLKVPVLRRTLPSPQVQPERRDQFNQLLASRDVDGRVDVSDVLRCGILIHSGSYTLRPAEHAMLGIVDGEGYGRATSPLRRYLDMVTHWQLKAGLLREAGLQSPPMFTPRELKELGTEQGAREYENSRLMAENERYWAVDCVQRVLDANASGTSDPVPMTFDSIVISSITFDIRTRETFVSVHVPALGLMARVTIPADVAIGLTVGDPLRIVVTGTRLGPSTVLAQHAPRAKSS